MARPAAARLRDGGALVALAVVQLIAGWFHFMLWVPLGADDEGYMVLMLRGWVDGGALYDRVFSQYGPLHTLVFGAPLRLLGIELTLTMGRVVTLAICVATSLVLALVARRLTHSLWGALATQVGSFLLLMQSVPASMHPGPLLMLLLAVLVLNVAWLRPAHPRLSDWVTGGGVAAVLLIKVNIGIFVLVAVAYVVASSWPAPRSRRVLRLLTEAALVLMGPVLLLPLMRTFDMDGTGSLFSWPHRSALAYWAVAYMAAAVAVVVLSRWSAEADGPAESESFSLLRLGGGFAVVAAATVVAIMAADTSPTSLVEGVLIRPTSQADALTILPRMTAATLLWVALLPAMLWLCWRIGRSPVAAGWLAGSAAVRVGAAAVGLTILVPFVRPSMVPDIPAGLFAFVPFASLVLLPRVGSSTVSDRQARLFLAVLAVGHSLHAFPVAGLQVAFSMLLPFVCLVVMFVDGGRELYAALQARSAPANARRPPQFVAALPVVVVLVWLSLVTFDDAREWRDNYRASAAVALPGTASMRASDASLASVRANVDALEQCDQFVTSPGLNSYYVFTGIDPPTGFNTTFWFDLLTDDEQQAVVNALEKTSGRVCLVSDPFLTYAESDQPLEQYLSEFVPASPPLEGLLFLERPQPR